MKSIASRSCSIFSGDTLLEQEKKVPKHLRGEAEYDSQLGYYKGYAIRYADSKFPSFDMSDVITTRLGLINQFYNNRA